MPYTIADIITFIDTKLSKSNGHLRPYPVDSWWVDNGYSDIQKEINRLCSFIENAVWPQCVWHIRNSIFTVKVCNAPGCTHQVQWNKTTSRYPQYCCTKCGSTSPEKLLKFKETCISRYGVSAPAQSHDILETRRQNSVKKYGVSSFSNTLEFKDKIKQTSLEKYGVDNVMKLPSTVAKVKSTNLERYGKVHALCLDEYKDKQKATNTERYGGNSPSCDATVLQKQKDTLFETYGVYNIKHTLFSTITLDHLNDKDYLLTLLNTNSATGIAKLLGVDVTTVLNYLKKHSIHDKLKSFSSSMQEQRLVDFLTSNNIDFIQHDRSILSPKELDFFIPAANLAIELCGVYWHSENTGSKDKWYHYNKWKACKDIGITLLTYFDDEFTKSQDIIESKILYECRISAAKRIGARSTIVKDIPTLDEFAFLEKHHVQGKLLNRNYSYGAYYNNELVGVMTLTNRKNYIEITRFSTNTSYIIRGLFSKMLAHFAIDSGYTGNIVSFSDNCHGNGRIYNSAGFSIADELGPGYYYTKNGRPRENRQAYMKSKIKEKFNVDISNKTEWQLMQDNGYDRVWDCGKIKWIKTL